MIVTMDGESSTRITTATTTQIVSKPGVLGRVVITNVGTTATLDIYDATSGTTLPIWRWVSADGKQSIQLGYKFNLGLRVVSGGTFGEALLIYNG